ncbi:hypothetical protein LXL04_006795 [Taraxacum kok-saghyz]
MPLRHSVKTRGKIDRLRVTKSSTERLQAKCGTDKKVVRCCFKLWASWMKQEKYFQIEGLNETHTCIREFKHGTLGKEESFGYEHAWDYANEILRSSLRSTTKGLVEAAKDVLPSVEHKQCARHVYANFKRTYNGLKYKSLLWAAATSTTEAAFEEKMQELKAINSNAYDQLMQREPHSWSMVFFVDGRACEDVENGISKSFNSVIVRSNLIIC